MFLLCVVEIPFVSIIPFFKVFVVVPREREAVAVTTSGDSAKSRVYDHVNANHASQNSSKCKLIFTTDTIESSDATVSDGGSACVQRVRSASWLDVVKNAAKTMLPQRKAGHNDPVSRWDSRQRGGPARKRSSPPRERSPLSSAQSFLHQQPSLASFAESSANGELDYDGKIPSSTTVNRLSATTANRLSTGQDSNFSSSMVSAERSLTCLLEWTNSKEQVLRGSSDAKQAGKIADPVAPFVVPIGQSKVGADQSKDPADGDPRSSCSSSCCHHTLHN